MYVSFVCVCVCTKPMATKQNVSLNFMKKNESCFCSLEGGRNEVTAKCLKYLLCARIVTHQVLNDA